MKITGDLDGFSQLPMVNAAAVQKAFDFSGQSFYVDYGMAGKDFRQTIGEAATQTLVRPSHQLKLELEFISVALLESQADIIGAFFSISQKRIKKAV